MAIKDLRLLDIYTRLLDGETIVAEEFSEKYQCDIKTIRRTLEDIKDFLSENGVETGDYRQIENISDSKNEFGRYRIVSPSKRYLSRGEVLAVCKILLDSRGLSKNEMETVLRKIVKSSVMEEDQSYIKDLLQNEWYNYAEPYHGMDLINKLFEISKAIKQQRLLAIDYMRSDKQVRERIVEPLGLIFNENYFYLAANIQNIDKEKHFVIKGDSNPTMYRVDRIHTLSLLDERYTVNEARRFNEGDYRKRIQFMFSGELKHVKLRVKDFALESVSDHLQAFITKIDKVDDYDYLVEGEVFGSGIVYYLLSQGDGVKLIEPEDLKETLAEKARDLIRLYE